MATCSHLTSLAKSARDERAGARPLVLPALAGFAAALQQRSTLAGRRMWELAPVPRRVACEEATVHPGLSPFATPYRQIRTNSYDRIRSHTIAYGRQPGLERLASQARDALRLGGSVAARLSYGNNSAMWGRVAQRRVFWQIAHGPFGRPTCGALSSWRSGVRRHAPRAGASRAIAPVAAARLDRIGAERYITYRTGKRSPDARPRRVA
jgi:hypothetical protein